MHSGSLERQGVNYSIANLIQQGKATCSIPQDKGPQSDMSCVIVNSNILKSCMLVFMLMWLSSKMLIATHRLQLLFRLSVPLKS